MNGVRWAENCPNPQAWRTLINGLCLASSRQRGQPCRGQFCGPCQSTSHQWPGQGHRLHANKFADDIKLGGWDGMPNCRASIRRMLLGLRTGSEDTSWGSIEVQRSALGVEKSHTLGRDGRAAALPKSSRHLQWVPGCKGTKCVLIATWETPFCATLAGDGESPLSPVT